MENWKDRAKLPQPFIDYIETKKKRTNTRPHFIESLSNPVDNVLDILELIWIKDRSIGSLARKHRVHYTTIARLLKDLEPYKKDLIFYLETVPRRKIWFNPQTWKSDYETVQNYADRIRRKNLKGGKSALNAGRKCWVFLKYKDPERWSIDDVLSFLITKKEGACRSGYFDAIRQVAPQFKNPESKHYMSTSDFRATIPRRKKDIYWKEFLLILDCLKKYKMNFHELILKLHVTIGCREGSKGPNDPSGLCGLTWKQFKKQFRIVDVYEIKVKKGIWWRNCPLELPFSDLPQKLYELWLKRGKPSDGKIILNGYPELLQIYKEIREALKIHYDGKLEPSLLEQFTELRPHDSDKLHCNLLFEAGATVAEIAGKYNGGNEGEGLFGRGWVEIGTVWKYYLSYSGRSARFQAVKKRVSDFCEQANQGNIVAIEQQPMAISPQMALKQRRS